MRFHKVKIAVIASLLLGGQAVQAATDDTTFQVTATVTESCNVTATDLAFGNYDPSLANTDNISTITVTCTKGSDYDIGLNEGIASGATVTTRQMIDPVSTDLLNYSLFSDSGRTTNWGNTVSTDTVHVASALGTPEVHTVFGRIPTGQYVTAGSYSDTITVTVTY
ncbi:Csu type fimbrial protein [Methylobacter sp.]|jgi:spore coat protein U-like protein|uniref:Csu type fimbrial protein n=1 Tax=Methylobacter sp. TaxID=2051955 RepID=UPI003DA20D44